jgi:hypothetical protein
MAHELFPGLVIAPRALRRLHLLDDLDQLLARVDGTAAMIARELVTRCNLTRRVNVLEREIVQIVRQLTPTLLAVLQRQSLHKYSGRFSCFDR